MTNDKNDKEEIDHIKSALRANCYPEWIFRILPKAKPCVSSSKAERLINVPTKKTALKGNWVLG